MNSQIKYILKEIGILFFNKSKFNEKSLYVVEPCPLERHIEAFSDLTSCAFQNCYKLLGGGDVLLLCILKRGSKMCQVLLENGEKTGSPGTPKK